MSRGQPRCGPEPPKRLRQGVPPQWNLRDTTAVLSQEPWGSPEAMSQTLKRIGVVLSEDRMREFCRRNHIRKLSLFGSVLREDFEPDSDIDVLVEFEPGKTPGLAFFGMQDELSEMLGRKVDLNTPACLSRHFREEVLREAEAQYVAA